MKHIMHLLLMTGMLSMGLSGADVRIWNEEAGHAPIQVMIKDGVLGQMMDLKAPFTGFGFSMPTYVTQNSSARLAVFRWQNDYLTTTANAPLYSKFFENCIDNATNWVTFPELPAGEYLFAIDSVKGNIGCWCSKAAPQSGGIIYLDGIGRKGDLQLTIRFAGDVAPAKPFGNCTVPPIKVSPPPPEYVLPADSAVYTHEVMPDTWAFTDGLGRRGLTSSDVGLPQADKTLALFYWTWHASFHGAPQNNQLVIDKHPEAQNDWDSPHWKKGVSNFWNEPIYGYYHTDEPWVLRRQAELLANAGVDVIFADNTNGTAIWRNSYVPLFQTWLSALNDGVKVPKVSFMLPFGPWQHANQQMEMLYNDIYRPVKYHQLWYYFDGKPMLMAWPDSLNPDSLLEKGLSDYFTFRRNFPEYINSKPELGHWGWLSTHPQAVYYANQADKDANRPEQITVGVAHNHDAELHALAAMNGRNIMGRSYTTKGYHREANAKLYGYNFAEQFDYALKVNPRVIFVTGWNEWIAGRYKEWPPNSKASVSNAFPDEFIDEFSRDLEPSKGDLKDHYYYQFVNYVRRYKGVRPVPSPSAPKSIDINGSFSQWEDVQPYFAAYRNNTAHRDGDGYKGCHYTDASGRNDIIGAKVARDDTMVYFMVECADAISPHTDPLWMTLYIDCQSENTGWNSFDYVINKTVPTATQAVIERFTGNGYDTHKVGTVAYRCEGRRLMLAIPKNLLQPSGDSPLCFAWTDHVHDADDKGSLGTDGRWAYSKFNGDIMDFYVTGDVAPGGRFKFQYLW